MPLPDFLILLIWIIALPFVGIRLLLLRVPIVRDFVLKLYRPETSEAEIRDPVNFRKSQLELEKQNDAIVGVPVEHAYFETEPGVFLHYATIGDKNKPVMLFLHGFPEFWLTYVHLLKEFSKTHRCVALDQRGYNISSKPPNLTDYSGKKLVADVERFAKFLVGENGKLIVVSHDWGAAVAWQAAHCCDFISKLVVLDMPHTMTFRRALLHSISQKRKSMYILFFQLPILADRLFSDPAKGTVGKLITSLTPQLQASFNRAAQVPGAMTGALNWYRCAFGMEGPKLKRKVLEIPVLQLMGANSTPFDLNAVNDGIEKYVQNLTQYSIPNASHWVQHDAPDVVIEKMREFL